MPEPKVSIIIGTFNRAHFILESLKSVFQQTFKDWECLIIDDGSSDNTKQIVSSYIIDDKRFNYLERPDSYKKGLPGARNYGLDNAKGDYIIFFDDDDYAHPEVISVCINLLLSNPDYDFCHFNKSSFTNEPPEMLYVKKKNIQYYPIGMKQIEEVISNKIPMASCTVLWRENCFANIRFNESLEYAEEWECYSRILLAGYSGIGINEFLYYNRKHADSNTGEFWRGGAKRKESQINAIILVMEQLKIKGYLTKTLFRYFIQMGIFLKDISIIKYLFKVANISLFVKFKYYLLFYFYPIIGRMYRLKKYLTNG
jgi:glycosyltransferase involved in cell wall biosynthesis